MDRDPSVVGDSRKGPGSNTVRLAIIFTLFMLGMAFVFWLIERDAAPATAAMLYIRTRPVHGVVGQEVTLEAFVGDQGKRPVAGFRLSFFEGNLLGSAVTGEDGRASIRHTFDRPGDFLVAVQPDGAEPADFRLANRGAIQVIITRPAGE